MRFQGRGRALCWVAAAVLLALHTAAARGQGLANAAQGSTSNVGYIDSAVPSNLFRIRVDAAYDINRSDRAEFIYSPGFDPKIDNQDIAEYVEMAFDKQFSGFIELHEHFVNPTDFSDDRGLGDTNLGFKWAFLRDCDQVATFQLRTYIPTGNPDHALGNGHISLEPALLFNRRLTDKLLFEGELRDWIPIDAGDVAGNVVRYGGGLSYQIFETENVRVCPVVELVGWSVLNGKESIAPGVFQEAGGDTIVNVKLGTRLHFGQNSELYVGYGRALTGDVWYKNILRAEYCISF